MRWLLLLAFTACDAAKPDPDPEWRTAPLVHHCTKEQMERVQTETEFCNKTTSYFSTYCYGSAIIRNCTKADAGS